MYLFMVMLAMLLFGSLSTIIWHQMVIFGEYADFFCQTQERETIFEGFIAYGIARFVSNPEIRHRVDEGSFHAIKKVHWKKDSDYMGDFLYAKKADTYEMTVTVYKNDVPVGKRACVFVIDSEKSTVTIYRMRTAG